jgi:putative MATE family efflux protein
MNKMNKRDIQKAILALAIPASLESVFQMALGFTDQVIIGRLGETSIAAVGLTNQMLFFSTLVLGTIGSSTAILVAQHHGKGDKEGVSLVFGASFLLAALIGLPFAAAAALFPGGTLSLLGAEAAVVDVGREFFRIIALTLPLSLLSAVVVSVLRSLGDARTPMLVTLGSVVLNTILSFALVFGVGAVPALGVTGAAIATLIVQVLRLGALLYVMLVRHRSVSIRPAHMTKLDRAVVSRLVALTYPIALIEMLWSFGSFLYTLLAVRLGTTEVAANQIVIAMEAVFLVCSSGLAVSGLTLVGQTIGAGDLAAMRSKSREVIRIGIYSSAFFGVLLAIATLLLRVFYPSISQEALTLATVGLVLNGLFQPAKVLNMIMGNGVLRAGGDTKFLLFADTVSMYAVGVPLAFALAFPLKLGLVGVFVGKVAEEVTRVAIFFMRYRTAKWHRSLAEEGPTVERQAA